MASSEPGDLFPNIALSDASGGTAPLPSGEALISFFHTDCATSEMSLPYLERIRRRAAGGRLRVIAVSQDGPTDTERLLSRFGAEVETLFDPPPWPASRSLGLVGVPVFFLVGEDGRIKERAVGFEKAKMEAFAARAAALADRRPEPLFLPGDSVPAIRPG